MFGNDDGGHGAVGGVRRAPDKRDVMWLKVKTVSSGAILDVPDADGLADDIEATRELGRKDTFRASYAVLIDGSGCLVKVGNGGFPIPWQHITTEALRASPTFARCSPLTFETFWR